MSVRLRSVITMIMCACSAGVLAGPPEKRVVQAIRAEKPPIIDADLGDPAWQSAPEITGFTQYDPNDGKPSTQNTVVKIVYDNSAIYVGAFMHDTRKVTTLLGRRDSTLESDWFRVSFDSQNDDLNGASFWVNPSNVQLDTNLDNDIYDDPTWDAVWESAAKIVPGGWIAEVRVPFSQLRFPDRAEHVWGVQLVRRIASNAEIARFVNVPKGETGWVSRFADLTGISGIHPDRALELLPYGVSRSDLTSRIAPGDPFVQPVAYRMDGGLDMKYGITSNLTLTGTLNPDFGQVEVDPAVVNLGQFETFFPEKRPFFVEGAQIFRFGSGPASSRWNFNLYPPQFFYSRRIGRSPQGSAAAEWADAPGETTIIGAAKLSGKFGKGWSVGVLDALTDREKGWFQDGSRRWSEAVEPMTNYLVTRATKEYGKNSRVGVLFTSVNRRLPSELSHLRQNAYVGGIDGYTLFRDKAWIWEWLVGGTLVEGSKESIDLTQTNSSHRYARPDATHLDYDPERTSLSGFGGRAMLGKQTGRWRPNLQVQTYSPGFDVNDVGYMQRVDVINAHQVMHYLDQTVRKRIREVSIWAGTFQNWNYGSDLVGNGIHGNWNIEAKNYWYTFGWFGGNPRLLDDRKTRGGPLVYRSNQKYVGAGIGSDSRKKVYFETSYEDVRNGDGGYSNAFNLYLNYRPTSAIRLNVAPAFVRSREYAQYVTTIDDKYIFATLEQRTLDIGTRVEWTVNSRLSLQLFLQPFIASGGYTEFKRLARPRSDEYAAIAPVGNPDFNLRSVRGSAVVRWEFRPGSSLYVVWSENRSDVAPIGDFRVRRDFAAIPDALSKDVFLIKVSYWLPM